MRPAELIHQIDQLTQRAEGGGSHFSAGIQLRAGSGATGEPNGDKTAAVGAEDIGFGRSPIIAVWEDGRRAAPTR